MFQFIVFSESPFRSITMVQVLHIQSRVRSVWVLAEIWSRSLEPLLNLGLRSDQLVPGV